MLRSALQHPTFRTHLSSFPSRIRSYSLCMVSETLLSYDIVKRFQCFLDIAAPYFADKMYQIFSEELIKFMAYSMNFAFHNIPLRI